MTCEIPLLRFEQESEVCFLCNVKVLIIHQHFKTPSEGGALRSYFLAKALARQGSHPVVITAGSDGIYKKTTVEDIEVHYLPVPYDNRFGFWRRGNSFLSFAWRSAMLAKRIPGITLCYAISVPLTTGLTATWLKRMLNIPFVFEVGDLWPDAPIAMGYVRNLFFQRFLYGLEASIYRQATAVVALSAPIQGAITDKIANKNVQVIPNMADTEFFQPSSKDDAVFSQYQLQGKFVVSYIGAVGVANGLDYFIECASASQREKLPVHFLLCGDGAMIDQHKLSAKRLQLENFTFIPFLDREGVRSIMNVTDAVFVCYKPYRILETGSPNKYFDGLAAGKLILVNFEGWIKAEIESERCGRYINREQPNDFVEVIKPFLTDRHLLQQFQRSARQLAVQRYSRTMLSERYIQFLMDLKT
ncbi:MAG TPA: glycosyltransferase family 4 protein [Chryseolinea sp.]|nr:glycosyltransferase family 4 protein [Chryseolinea sp.]